MTTRRYRVAALAALVGCMAPAFAQDAFTLADYSGEELFARYCSGCHGETGRGGGPASRDLDTVVPDLTTIRERHGEFMVGYVRDAIDGRGAMRAHGTREMPVWGRELWAEAGGDVVAQRTVRDAIDRLVDYLRSVQRETRPRDGR